MGLPIPDLDNKTFDEIVEEARLLLSRYARETWTDHNIHDPGITFLELFAWLAETLIYQLNQVTDEHYLNFLELMGFYPADTQPARVDITFKNVTHERALSEGDKLFTKLEDEKITFEAKHASTLIPARLEKIITVFGLQTIDNSMANEQADIHFSPFGEKPREGASLLLGFDRPFPKKEIQITLCLFEGDLPPLGSHGAEHAQISPSAEVAWEYLSNGAWYPLAIKRGACFSRADAVATLTRSGRIVFNGPLSMDKKAGCYWIRCRLKKAGYEIVPMVNRILLNTVSAVQVETAKKELLGKGTGVPGQKVFLKKLSVIRNSLVIMVQKDFSVWEDWKEVKDFELSGPDSHHYLFDPEKGEITFGNGLNGRIPLTSETIKAAYKTTLGAKGNIPKKQRFSFHGISGENLKEAAGGKDAESIDQAKARARKDFNTQYYAVTSEDYETLALSTPGLRVARATAIPNYNNDFPGLKMPGAVTVVVAPYAREGMDTPYPGEGFINTVITHLKRHRLITTDVQVIGPEYVGITVKGIVRIKRTYKFDQVKKEIHKALKNFLNPLKRRPHEGAWPFGRPVYPSEIYHAIYKVNGVDYLTDLAISARGNYKENKADGSIIIPPVALVYYVMEGEHDIESPEESRLTR